LVECKREYGNGGFAGDIFEDVGRGF